MKCQLNDWVGYQKHREQVDATILDALADDGKTHAELAMRLREAGIGDAKSDDPVELAYSSTGAILRSAVCQLRWTHRIYDSWDMASDRHEYPKPFRFFRCQ